MNELLAELFNHYYKDIYTYLYSLCRDVSLSEDLTSDVFLEVVKSIATFRGESDIKTWLFSIARHKWYMYLRKKSRQIQTESIHDLYDSAFIGVNEAPSNSEWNQMIQALLEMESELTQNVFQMRLDGYSYYEIASKYQISENSARVIIFRVKAKIKKYLEREGFYHE